MRWLLLALQQCRNEQVKDCFSALVSVHRSPVAPLRLLHLQRKLSKGSTEKASDLVSWLELQFWLQTLRPTLLEDRCQHWQDRVEALVLCACCRTLEEFEELEEEPE